MLPTSSINGGTPFKGVTFISDVVGSAYLYYTALLNKA